MCLHPHAHKPHPTHCNNDVLIIAGKGHCREAGTVPTAAFKKLLGKKKCCILSSRCTQKAVGHQHEADLLDGRDRKCQLLNSEAERWQRCGINSTVFEIYESQWSSCKTSCESKPGLLDCFESTSTHPADHVVMSVKAHKSISFHHLRLHRCVGLQQ